MTRLIIIALAHITISGCGVSAKKVKLEKIIFHTTLCFGTCPAYHLQVDDEKKVKLYVEQAYKYPKDFTSYEIDTSKTGYFIGLLSDTTFDKLTNELNAVQLDKLEFDGASCCDGSLITIIIYYNGQRKFLRSMFPPDKANNLIESLYNICETSPLMRTRKKFDIENEKDIR